MAKASKPKPTDKTKKDIRVKTNLTADQLLHAAINTPIKKSKN